MGVEGFFVVVLDTASSNVGFIRNDKSRRHGADGFSGSFVVVSDCHYDIGNFRRIHSHSVENSESHNGSALGMVASVDNVSDIVEISGNFNKFNFPFGIAESFHNICGFFRNKTNVGKAMFRKTDCFKSIARFLNINFDRRVVFYHFISYQV